MSQETNLNVSPYFDDFSEDKDFYKVLFKPGYPVQARELTTLQSILQNQIERFGQHFFREGAKVIPGNTGYNALYYCVRLNNTFQGVPIEAYVSQLVGTKIVGETSGVTAVVDYVLPSNDSTLGNVTLYVNYLGSSTQNNQTQGFFNGENLITTTTITSGLLGNSTIPEGDAFATTVSTSANAIGSAFQIQEGIYFIRGNFVKVETETIILDQYSNKPNYRVGLYVDEEIVTPDMDESLSDNSQGFNNYAAPGADRLRIRTGLFKKSLTDFNDNGFVELATIVDGEIRSQQKPSGSGTAAGMAYQDWTDILARRTYAESGDYYVSPFDISVKESLNDNLGNRGVYEVGQFTYGGSAPTDDLSLYHISPGKALVRGYECETLNSVYLDSPKSRTTAVLQDQAIAYNTGPTFRLNRVYGSPRVGLGNTYYVSLRDSRVGVTQTVEPGEEIGVARVYDFKMESGAYNALNSDINEWDIALYDVQMFTEITLNEPVSLYVPTRVKGNNSGATAFLVDSVVDGTTIKVYDVSGTFLLNESFSFDGVSNGRVAIAITSKSVSDVKSVYSNVGVGITFSADAILATKFSAGISSITPYTAGISTITSTNPLFTSNVKVNDIIKYTDPLQAEPIYTRVTGVTTADVTVTGITTVSGVANGYIRDSIFTPTDLAVLTSKLETSTDNTLYTRLPRENVSSVDLNDAYLVIRKSYTVNITNGQLSVAVNAGPNQTFLPFDEERYALLRSDGTTETLTSDRISITNGGATLQIYNLGSDNAGAILLVTVRKNKPKEKTKRKNRVNSVVIDKSILDGSGTGDGTFDDGLTFGNYPFGTRVQDESISLGVSDIIEVHDIFEAPDSSTEPSAPTMVIAPDPNGGVAIQTTDLLIGEKITGQSSGAVAIVAERLLNNKLSFLYKNNLVFKEGEVITFGETGLTAQINVLENISRRISSNYKFETGQRSTFYDYGFITRKSTADAPYRKIRVYFANGYYDPTDDGDITTANSYSSFSYSREIRTVNGIRNTDIIDIRPKTADYLVSENSRSPFEFFGRSFASSANSSTNVLASDESLLISLSYYLGRVDRIYLSKDGKFQVKYGTPSEKLEKPVSVDDALEIATVTLPPYLYSTSDAIVDFVDHKRYRMIDIKKSEDRIKNLEYYTSLSLLESNTSSLFVADNDGLNRFKSGFFVDNFTTFLAQEDGIFFKNSIDVANKELRPSHYTTSVDLINGPVTGVSPLEDYKFLEIEGINVRNSNEVLTLDYSEVEWLKQTFATRTESVTPFLISFWQGTLELTPASDTWVDTVRLEAKIIQTEGNYERTLADAVRNQNVDPQTGFAPVVWNAWETTWTGQEVVTGTAQRTVTTGGQWRGVLWGGTGRSAFETQTTTVFQDTTREVRDTGVQTRTGSRTVVTEQFDLTSVGDRVVNRSLVSFMRSRNIEFAAKKVKPLTRLYAFFDGQNVTKYCVPKLLEIQMISGVFQVGETVIGDLRQTGLVVDSGRYEAPSITFRAAQSNHREGPYDSPTVTYPQNPYNSTVLQSSYSSTSTILNVDTFSLANQPQGEFSGYVESGMTLVGSISGAQATITNVRLVSDIAANLQGALFVPNPNNAANPRFETGTKTFTLVNNPDNDQNTATTIAEEAFTSSGTLETVQENIISVRNARIENKQEFEERAVARTTGTQVVNSTAISQTSRSVLIGWYDPLAQSFLVDNDTGVFVTRCDVFFASKDDMEIPVTIQLRTMQNGFPTQHILPLSEIVLDPADINVSGDGSVATSFNFKAPVYLEGGKEYAICLASNSTKYSVYISRIGENDLLTQTYISNQPYLGSLFKSQNASTWEASQWEDLKFTLYRADFASSGSVEFYNPDLTDGNKQIATLLPDSINTSSRRLSISIGSTIVDDNVKIGQTISQFNSSGTGNLVGTAGSATGSLNIINPGIGYTPASGVLQFDSVPLQSLTGSGLNATASITISNGVAVAATITDGGYGYKIGDTLGITSIGNLNTGLNATFSLVSIAGTNQFILDNVQGDFTTGVANTLRYTNSSGVTTTIVGNPSIQSINTLQDGLHFRVDHTNHGMYASQNLVFLNGIQPDTKPTKLILPVQYDQTTEFFVEDSSDFSTFEGVGIGTTNPGYALIGNEVISYTSVAPGVLSGVITRALNGVNVDYDTGTPIFKYELSGVSLRRINRTHDLQSTTVVDPIGFDYYTIKIDTTTNGIDRSISAGFPTLYFNQTKSSGGYKVRATQNIPFEIVTPVVHNVTVQGTNLSAEMRTITGTSLSGNEFPFVDNGYEIISLNKSNYLDSPRLIASIINEYDKLANLPGNKSFNMRLLLSSINSYLTPVVDLQRVSAIFTSNRVNQAVFDYANDNRVNSITEDPSAFQYLSKEITLENSATSLKILLSAHINEYCDIRAFYAIGNSQNFNPIYTPFPGWSNLDYRGRVINPSTNDGQSDVYVAPTTSLGFESDSIEFKDYTFTADNLPSFRSYRIKLVATSRSQVYVPRIKDFRVIALA